MPERRRNTDEIKKDQSGPREAREELEDVIRSGGTKPLVDSPNRDRARGDWDRSGGHHDENNTVDDRAENSDERSQG